MPKRSFLVIDRERVSDSDSMIRLRRVMVLLDFVFVREHDGKYSVLKNRYNGEMYQGLDEEGYQELLCRKVSLNDEDGI